MNLGKLFATTFESSTMKKSYCNPCKLNPSRSKVQCVRLFHNIYPLWKSACLQQNKKRFPHGTTKFLILFAPHKPFMRWLSDNRQPTDYTVCISLFLYSDGRSLLPQVLLSLTLMPHKKLSSSIGLRCHPLFCNLSVKKIVWALSFIWFCSCKKRWSLKVTHDKLIEPYRRAKLQYLLSAFQFFGFIQ